MNSIRFSFEFNEWSCLPVQFVNSNRINISKCLKLKTCGNDGNRQQSENRTAWVALEQWNIETTKSYVIQSKMFFFIIPFFLLDKFPIIRIDWWCNWWALIQNRNIHSPMIRFQFDCLNSWTFSISLVIRVSHRSASQWPFRLKYDPIMAPCDLKK